MEEVLRNCRNCGARLHGEYCCDCGQREGRADERFIDLARDLAGDLIDIDSRFWRTLFPLVFRPGFLSAEFFAGRRARYLPPLRLYLIFSFLLFLSFSLTATGFKDGPVTVNSDGVYVEPEQLEKALEDAPNKEELKKLVQKAQDGELQDPNDNGEVHFNIAGEDGPAWARRLEARLEGNTEKVKQDPRRMVESMLNYAPQMMFVLLPLFAMLVQWMYLFSGFHYLQHLVFGLHYHAFIYLLYLVEIGLEHALPSASGYLSIWALAYLPLALRRAYGSGWGGAFWKSLFLYFSYGLCITFGLAAVAIIALALL